MLKLALIQIDSTDNVKENLDKISALVHSVKDKADFVILPEHSDGIGKDDLAFSCDIPGEISDFFVALAKECGVYLHCGSLTENSENGKPYNTSLLISPSGEIIGKYSKLHLFDVDLPDGTGCRESSVATAGREIVVANTNIGNVGMAICYDIRFPELFRKMALMGAELITVCANFTAPTGAHHWKPLLQARAIENGCFVAAVNQCGTKPQFEAYGHTMLIDPWGKIIGELDQKEGVLLAEIDLNQVAETRAKIPSLKNRRTDIY